VQEVARRQGRVLGHGSSGSGDIVLFHWPNPRQVGRESEGCVERGKTVDRQVSVQ
jgi:hypothetical protein